MRDRCRQNPARDCHASRRSPRDPDGRRLRPVAPSPCARRAHRARKSARRRPPVADRGPARAPWRRVAAARPTAARAARVMRSPMPRSASSSAPSRRPCPRFQPATNSGTATFSAAVNAGSRLNCWNTNPRFRRRNRMRCFVAIRAGAFSEHLQIAFAGVQEARNDRNQRRLAATRRADQHRQFAHRDIQIEPAQRLNARVALPEPLRNSSCSVQRVP